jgi:hypothetical protein
VALIEPSEKTKLGICQKMEIAKQYAIRVGVIQVKQVRRATRDIDLNSVGGAMLNNGPAPDLNSAVESLLNDAHGDELNVATNHRITGVAAELNVGPRAALGTSPARGRQPQQKQESLVDVAAMLVEKGASPTKAKQYLMEKGASAEDATKLFSRAVGAKKQAKRAEASHNMVVGGIWAVVGLAVTAGTYFAAAPGGTYFVASGAVIFGALQFFKGVFQAGKK